MNKWIIFIFFSLIFSQQEFSYNNMVKMWMDYKFDDQQEFRYQVNEYLSYLDPSQNIDEVKLNFWMVRSYYSDGEIEEAELVILMFIGELMGLSGEEVTAIIKAENDRLRG